MADLITTCIGCYNIIFENCGDNISLPTGLSGGTGLAWKITDKFGNIYGGYAAVDKFGNIIIDTTPAAGWPAGIFTPASGVFTFEAYIIPEGGDADECSSSSLTICEEIYKCIAFSFASTSNITTP